MLDYAIAILSVALLCAGWAWLQLFLRKRDPESRMMFERGCTGRGDCGKPGCGGEDCRVG